MTLKKIRLFFRAGVHIVTGVNIVICDQNQVREPWFYCI